jgi:hypothetical protein
MLLPLFLTERRRRSDGLQAGRVGSPEVKGPERRIWLLAIPRAAKGLAPGQAGLSNLNI